MKFFHFRYSDQKFEQLLGEKGINAEITYSTTKNHRLRSIKIASPATKTVVFLHGAPGSSKDFTKYLSDKELIQHANLIAVDRPGYGNSNYGQPTTSVKQQALVISQVIPDSSVVLGHSYGGPVAAAIAMCCPEKVARLLLLAPAIDPDNEKQFRINRLLVHPPLRWFLSGAIKVAIEEKLSHENALRAIMGDWPKITCPVTIMHGQNDWIVPDDNVQFLKTQLTNAPLEVIHSDSLSHMMIWDRYDSVKELIIEHLD